MYLKAKMDTIYFTPSKMSEDQLEAYRMCLGVLYRFLSLFLFSRNDAKQEPISLSLSQNT